jgi:hypothetical protein
MRILRGGGYLSERPALKSLPIRLGKQVQARGSTVVPLGSQPGETAADGARRLRGWHGFALGLVLSTALMALVGSRGTNLDGILFPHW